MALGVRVVDGAILRPRPGSRHTTQVAETSAFRPMCGPAPGASKGVWPVRRDKALWSHRPTLTSTLLPAMKSLPSASAARRSPALHVVLPLLALAVSLTGWRPWPAQARATTDPASVAAAVGERERWVRSEVYFGMSTPGGELITPEAWQEFLNTEITPRFPAGLSVIDTAGQWRNAGGHIDREPGKLLVLLHPDNSAADAAIEEIRRLYCGRFRQEAVMRVEVAASVTF